MQRMERFGSGRWSEGVEKYKVSSKSYSSNFKNRPV